MTRRLHKGEREMIDRNIFYDVDKGCELMYRKYGSRAMQEQLPRMRKLLPGFAIKTNPFMQHAGKEEFKECN